MRRDQLEAIVVAVAAVVVPALLTAILLQLKTTSSQREYVFIYMAVVAVVAVARGLWPALLAAAVSFVLVDYFIVPPTGTLTIADEQDLVNLAIFFGTAVSAMEEKAPAVLAMVEQVSAIMLKVTSYVMKTAPLAIFAALAATVATQGIGVLATYEGKVVDIITRIDLIHYWNKHRPPNDQAVG